jgi:deazaflavin-dependent oxidoreductase (nitroreductase family)
MASAPSKRLIRILKAANSVHVALYRISGGKFGNKIANLPVLLITTFGRKSGKPYTNPVVFIQDGLDYLVSATAGGSDWDPGWYLNLKTRPEAKIEVGDASFNVQATIAENEERTRLYEKFKAASGNFVKYEQNISRVLPVIRLTPNHVPQKDT